MDSPPRPVRTDTSDEVEVPVAASCRIRELEEKVAQLETALHSRILIEQAKGVLAERLSMTVTEAFDLLRYAARSHRQKIHHVALRVVEERATPGPVVVAIAKTQRLRAVRMREIEEAHRAQLEELQQRVNKTLLGAEGARRPG